MTFLDLTKELRWLVEAEAVLAELDGEATTDPDERALLDELRKTTTETRSRLMPECA